MYEEKRDVFIGARISKRVHDRLKSEAKKNKTTKSDQLQTILQERYAK